MFLLFALYLSILLSLLYRFGRFCIVNVSFLLHLFTFCWFLLYFCLFCRFDNRCTFVYPCFFFFESPFVVWCFALLYVYVGSLLGYLCLFSCWVSPTSFPLVCLPSYLLLFTTALYHLTLRYLLSLYSVQSSVCLLYHWFMFVCHCILVLLFYLFVLPSFLLFTIQQFSVITLSCLVYHYTITCIIAYYLFTIQYLQYHWYFFLLLSVLSCIPLVVSLQQTYLLFFIGSVCLLLFLYCFIGRCLYFIGQYALSIVYFLFIIIYSLFHR